MKGLSRLFFLLYTNDTVFMPPQTFRSRSRFIKSLIYVIYINIMGLIGNDASCLQWICRYLVQEHLQNPPLS